MLYNQPTINSSIYRINTPWEESRLTVRSQAAIVLKNYIFHDHQSQLPSGNNRAGHTISTIPRYALDLVALVDDSIRHAACVFEHMLSRILAFFLNRSGWGPLFPL